MNAQLHIHVAAREGISWLKHSYFTTPFKVANITQYKKDAILRLMLMSCSPGILDGDDYCIKIELDEGTALQLHTQSYQRLFNMKQNAAQKMDVHLSKNTSFCFIPHPAVPHEQSNFTSRNNFFLSGGCSLIFGEILTCGRKLNGEAFLFSKYHTVTKIFIDDKLMIKENLLIEPATINVNAIGQLEGFTHQASLIYLNENAITGRLIASIIEMLSPQENIAFGVTALPANGLIVRLLGQKAEQLFDCLKMIAGCLPTNHSNKPLAYAI